MNIYDLANEKIVLKNNIELSDPQSKLIEKPELCLKRKSISILIKKDNEIDCWFVVDLPFNFSAYNVTKNKDEIYLDDYLGDAIILKDNFVKECFGIYPPGQYAILTFVNNHINGLIKFVYDITLSFEEFNGYNYTYRNSHKATHRCSDILSEFVDSININNETIFYADLYLTDLPITNGLLSFNESDRLLKNS
jgi:hypothetical protein